MLAKEFLLVLNEICLFVDRVEVEAMLDPFETDEAMEDQHKDKVEEQKVNTFANDLIDRIMKKKKWILTRLVVSFD